MTAPTDRGPRKGRAATQWRRGQGFDDPAFKAKLRHGRRVRLDRAPSALRRPLTRRLAALGATLSHKGRGFGAPGRATPNLLPSQEKVADPGLTRGRPDEGADPQRSLRQVRRCLK